METACIVMDLQEKPAEILSKLLVHLFTNNWKTSSILSYIKVFYYTVRTIKPIEDHQNVALTIDTMNANSQIVTYYKSYAGSNYYKKQKKLLFMN